MTQAVVEHPCTNRVVLFPRVVVWQVVSPSSFPSSPVSRKARFYARYLVQRKTWETYLHLPGVVDSRHKVLAEDRDPFDVSLPLGRETGRGHRVGVLQEGAKKG